MHAFVKRRVAKVRHKRYNFGTDYLNLFERTVTQMANTPTQSKPIKTANFSMRIEEDKKASLELLYAGLGMTLTEAVKVFFEKSLNVGGIPFDLRMENYSRETLEAMRETLDIEAGRIPAKRYSSVDELFAENDAEIAAEELANA